MNRETVSIKGTRNGLVILLDTNREFEELKKTLHNKMKSARGFFKGARFFFSGEQLKISSHQKNELENICRQYGLVPVPDDNHSLYKKNFTVATHKASSTTPHSEAGEAAFLLMKSLRSGQAVVHSNHVVIVGDVHPGAEVVSGKSIIIIGNCRGSVHAGRGGNRSASVIALTLAPTVLSIADKMLSPDLIERIPAGCTAARLSGTEIIFEKINNGR